jgi:hypothetical protein
VNSAVFFPFAELFVILSYIRIFLIDNRSLIVVYFHQSLTVLRDVECGPAFTQLKFEPEQDHYFEFLLITI